MYFYPIAASGSFTPTIYIMKKETHNRVTSRYIYKYCSKEKKFKKYTAKNFKASLDSVKKFGTFQKALNSIVQSIKFNKHTLPNFISFKDDYPEYFI